MLESQGPVRLPQDWLPWVREALDAPGTSLELVDPDVVVASSRLPGVLHRDPADRILVASARVHPMILITKDERILAYSRDRYAEVLSAQATHQVPGARSYGTSRLSKALSICG